MKLFEADVSYSWIDGDVVAFGGFTCQLYAKDEKEARELIALEQKGATVKNIKEIEDND